MTHRSRHNPRSNRGMTLMEILIVVTIIVVMFGVSFPMMRGYNEHNKLRAAAREFVALMKYARTEAVLREHATGIFVDYGKRQFWLDLREVDPKTGTIDPKRKKTSLEIKRELNKDIWIDEIVTEDKNIVKDKVVAIDFYPDGSCSGVLMTVANREGAKLTVELLKSTGLTEVYKGTIEELRAKEQEEAASNPALSGANGATGAPTNAR